MIFDGLCPLCPVSYWLYYNSAGFWECPKCNAQIKWEGKQAILLAEPGWNQFQTRWYVAVDWEKKKGQEQKVPHLYFYRDHVAAVRQLRWLMREELMRGIWSPIELEIREDQSRLAPYQSLIVSLKSGRRFEINIKPLLDQLAAAEGRGR